MTINSATVTGAGFTMTGGGFPATLNPGQSTTVTVHFAPTATGAAVGALQHGADCGYLAKTAVLKERSSLDAKPDETELMIS